jgi:hypothetical protein
MKAQISASDSAPGPAIALAMDSAIDSTTDFAMERPAAAGQPGYRKLPYTVFAAILAAELAAILALNHGMLVYSLDDAYIHLALAARIWTGTYGINVHEVSAPASSILWPFLLAPFSALPMRAYILVPCVLNILAASFTLKLLVAEVRRAVAQSPAQSLGVVAAVFAAGLVVAANLIPIVFTGMEHSLQQLLAVTIVAGLIAEGRTGRAPRTLWIALVLIPLVRYDSLALAVPALLYFLWRGHWRGSLLATIAIGAVCGAFSAFLLSHGLKILPASVMAKSEVMRASGAPVALLFNVYVNLLSDTQGNVMLAGLVLTAAAWFDNRRPAAERGLALALTGALAVEFLLGKFGSYYRYEAYIWTAMLVALIHLYRGTLARVLAPDAALAPQLALVGVLAAASLSYLFTLASTPFASNNIYDQQYQMHRFVSDYYHEPVAVNDLGWVSFQNPSYVLDLAGLASQEALAARLNEPNSDWMRRLSVEHGVRLAMIYDGWFPSHPTGWVRVGTLKFHQIRVTAAESEVAFYATDLGAVPSIRAALADFQQTLPPRVSFHFDPPPPT